ncbi:MAG: hypothetical protein MUO50_05240, partial [Longimicrobiales bacterium]|nr:hypothetical protein [Longimicrobiales bacterium]
MNSRPFRLPGVKPISLLWCALAAMVAGACDEPFMPIAPSEVQFSVFGYLDASADTQWVRVMPLRHQVLTSPDSFGATVTLERLGTSRIIELRDSVFLFTDYVNPELGSEGVYVHNFWTTEKMEPGATYRFSAGWNGEEPAEAVVEIPQDYEVEVWLKQGFSGTDYLRLDGVKNVPFVTANAHFYDRCGSSVDSVWYAERSAEEDVYSIPIRKAAVTPREGCGTPGIEERELWVVGSESAWPAGQEYSPWGLAVQERASNVTNAVGFLGGVLTKVIPYENCTFQGGGAPVPEHCRLRYNQESAT